MEKLQRIVSKTVTGVVFGIAVFACFFFIGDVQQVKEVVSTISWQLILLSMLTTIVSYLMRFCKWQILLKKLQIQVPTKDSLYIFFIGLSMSITPGKIGELLKSYLLKNISGVKMSHSASAVFVDRLTDLFSMLLLVGVGASFFSLGFISCLAIFCVLLTIVFILQSKELSISIISKLSRIRIIGNQQKLLISLYEGTYSLLKIKNFLFTTAISTIAWFLECLSLYILFFALNIDFDLLHTIFVFSFGTLAGALSMLPGGLGVAEGSITGMLLFFNIEKSTAITITLLIRLITLWLGVIIGLTIFFVKRKKYLTNQE